MPEAKPVLPFHERLLALGVTGFFVFVALFNFILDRGDHLVETGTPHYIKNPLIEVAVKGKVKNPGIYQVKKGTVVAEVIRLAEPLKGADLKRVKLDSKITRRRTILIR